MDQHNRVGRLTTHYLITVTPVHLIVFHFKSHRQPHQTLHKRRSQYIAYMFKVPTSYPQVLWLTMVIEGIEK